MIKFHFPQCQPLPVTLTVGADAMAVQADTGLQTRAQATFEKPQYTEEYNERSSDSNDFTHPQPE